MLNRVYVNTRYPSDIGLLPKGEPSQADIKQFCDIAKEAGQKIREKLGVVIEEKNVLRD